jgi:hypothetical protein
MTDKETQLQACLHILYWKMYILTDNNLQYSTFNKLKYVFEIDDNDNLYNELNNFIVNFKMMSKLWDFLFQNNNITFDIFNATIYSDKSNINPEIKAQLIDMLKEFLYTIKLKMFGDLYDFLIK